MPPLGDLFDFYGRHAMKGDVADVVQVPLEAAEVIQQTNSIYSTRIYISCWRILDPSDSERSGARRLPT